jgi:hypothetical protein
MHTDSHYNCDRCGTRMNFPEYTLKEKVKHDRFLLPFGCDYDKTVGEYCEDCGEIIKEMANIHRC